MSLSHEEKLARQRGYWQKHRDKRIAGLNAYRMNNAEKIRAQQREYRERNKEKIAQRNRANYEKNKEARAEYGKQWNADRRKSDPIFRLKDSLRTRTSAAIRRGGFTKASRLTEIMGCDWSALKAHLEKFFAPGMSWENYGTEWVVDHHVPLASACDKDHLLRLCHHTNLRPLGKVENLRKAASMPTHEGVN